MHSDAQEANINRRRLMVQLLRQLHWLAAARPLWCSVHLARIDGARDRFMIRNHG